MNEFLTQNIQGLLAASSPSLAGNTRNPAPSKILAKESRKGS